MTGHPTIEALLEVRDGEGSPEATEHARACAECAAEVERLREVASALRGLPAIEPDRDGWPEVRAVLEGESRAWVPKAVAGTLIALAASLIVLLVVPREDSSSAGRDGAGRVARRAAAVDSEALAGLVQESQRLEDLLRAAGARRQVVDGWSASRVAEIQDRVAFIDAQLAESESDGVTIDRRMLLWRTRVGLMNELVHARVTRPQYVEF